MMSNQDNKMANIKQEMVYHMHKEEQKMQNKLKEKKAKEQNHSKLSKIREKVSRITDTIKNLYSIRAIADIIPTKTVAGLALASGLYFGGKSLFTDSDVERVPFNEQKDFAAAIVKDNKVTRLTVPEKTLQLDSLLAVENIEGYISSKFVDNADKREVAATVYSNIKAIEEKANGMERPALDENDPVLNGTKGYGKTTSGYFNPKFNSVKTDVKTKVLGKNNKYDISVETPNGYSGFLGYNLRNERVRVVMAKNKAMDRSWIGDYR